MTRKTENKGAIMSGSIRSGPSSPGSAILSRDAVLLMLYASAENRDWGVGCIETRSSSS
jgi:hypothetical protein